MNYNDLINSLDYNPDNGLFVWKVRNSNRTKIGAIAGVKTKNGYISISINKKKEYAHRLAVLYMTGSMPDDCVDHINGVRDDNRFSNLRIVSKGTNNKNQHLARGAMSSLGVSQYKTKKGVRYRATITEDGKFVHIGSFDCPIKAAEAYKEYRKNRGI